ncbi:MAG: competence protein ComJ [Planctomycetaceae bacterium]
MTDIQSKALKVFADYHQFYVQDGGINPPAPEDWTDEDIEQRCKVEENIVVVCPLRNRTVPVEVVLHQKEPACQPMDWDHIVECSLELPTGHLQVHECTGSAVLDWNVPAGTYVVRLLYGGLETIDDSGMVGSDHYKVELWPGNPRQLKLVRSWPCHEG